MKETLICIRYKDEIAQELATFKRFVGQIYLLPGALLHAPCNILVVNLEDLAINSSSLSLPQTNVQGTKLYEECLSPIKRAFPWFKSEMPEKDVLLELRRLALKYEIAIVYYTYLERGDTIYYDFSWVFDYRARLEAAQSHKRCENVQGESLYIAETLYMGNSNDVFVVRDDRQGALEKAKLAVFSYLKCHLGINIGSGFTIPDMIDWAKYRNG